MWRRTPSSVPPSEARRNREEVDTENVAPASRRLSRARLALAPPKANQIQHLTTSRPITQRKSASRPSRLSPCPLPLPIPPQHAQRRERIDHAREPIEKLPGPIAD